jgi:hypothetical protein
VIRITVIDLRDRLKGGGPGWRSTARKLQPSGSGENIEKNVDKVKVARRIAEGTPDFEKLDLRQRLDDLVQMIRHANQ